MVLLHYNLSFKRSSKGFKIQGGLITRKDTSALDHKIQVVSWSDNLLKKIFQIKDLKLKQASSIEVDQKQSITIPSCKQSHIDQVLKSLYGVQALNNIQLQKISPKYLIRRNLILSLVFAIPIVALTYFDQYRQLTAVTVIYILLFIYNYLSYKKKSFGYNRHMLMIKSGSYGDQMTVLPIYKIQSVAKSQTPYQRRNQLANLIVTTASGKLRIPYIPNQIVDQMINFFLMLIETNRKPWM